MRAWERGFSLVEMSVVLFVGGVMFLTVPMVVQSLTTLTTSETSQGSLETVEQAILGFVLTQGRLPCPDSARNGIENCDADVGEVPFRTLGLTAPPYNPQGFRLRYGVFNELKTILPTDFEPLLPPPSYSSIDNGLDFCMRLVDARQWFDAVNDSALRVQALDDAGSAINVAFVLVDPGPDGDFHSDNTGPAFASPGRELSPDYDNRVRAMGFGQLAALLSCPALIARINTSARDAFAAYDLARAAQWYRDFRDYGVEVREGNLEGAKYSRDLVIATAAFDIADNAASGAIAVATTAGKAAYATSIALSAYAIAMSAYAITTAEQNVKDKQGELDTANEQLEAAQTTLDAVEADRDQRINTAIQLEQRGFFQ